MDNSSLLERAVRRLSPARHDDPNPLKPGDTLGAFVWRASGIHQVYVGVLAVAVSLLSFIPVAVQRRIIDGAIVERDSGALLLYCSAFLAVILVQAALKYVLLIYQSWVSESVIKFARVQLAQKAAEHMSEGEVPPETVSVLGVELDYVGGFVGTSISDAVVNVSFIAFMSAYLIYLQPATAVGCIALLIPQVVLAPYLQPKLDELVARQVQLVRALGEEVREGTRRSTGTRSKIGQLFGTKMTYFALKFGLKGLLNFVSSLAPLIALFAGGLLVIRGSITIGALVAFVTGLDRMASPLRDLLNFYREAAQTRVHHILLLEWLANGPTKTDGG